MKRITYKIWRTVVLAGGVQLSVSLAYGGDLVVEGNLTVQSNLAAQSVTLGGDTRTAWPDTISSNSADGRYVNVIGDVMTGDLNVKANVDVTSPFQALRLANEISATPSGGNRPQSLFVQGQYAYGNGVVFGEKFSVYDISNPALPVLIGMIDLVGEAQGRDLRVDSDFAYTSGGNGFGFVIISVTNKQAPNVVMYTNAIGSFFPKGNRLYTCMNNALIIYDTTDKNAWSVISSNTLTGAGELVVEGDLAYISRSGGLSIYNVSNAASPSLVGSLTISDLGRLKKQGTRLYSVVRVSAGFSWDTRFSIMDVSNPANPSTLLSPTTVSGYNEWFDVDGGNLYIAGDNLYVVDVSNPASPVVDWSSNVTGSVNIGGIWKVGRYLLTFSYFNNKLNAVEVVAQPGTGSMRAESVSVISGLTVSGFAGLTTNITISGTTLQFHDGVLIGTTP